jgi:hypothetical protein
MDPVRVVAVCDTEDGRRCVSISEDPELARQVCAAEFVGTAVMIRSGALTPA